MTKPATRQGQLAAIHMAQKKLHLSKEDASAVKFLITGKYSAAEMTDLERRQYLAHLSNQQARDTVAQGSKPSYTPQRPPLQRSVDDDQDARWSKARALWAALATVGYVHHDTDHALMAWIKRQTHVEHWRFLNTHQINRVIESLKQMCAAKGVPTHTAAGEPQL